jgi:eukaryotic-like serine/threonine-protein kinase
VLRGPTGQMVLGSTTITVGRASDNQVVVDDPKVSSRQAEIRPTAQGYTITDLGSSNGTFVDGQRLDVNAPRLLMPGSTIRFGDTTFTYEVPSTPVNQAQWSSAENQPNPGPFPPPSTTYGAQPEYVPPPPSGYSPYQPVQPQSYAPPPPPAAYPPYDPMLQQSYNPYTPPPPTYDAMTPIPTQQMRSRGPRGGRTILLIALAVLVILAGVGLFFVIRNNQVAAYNANATATARVSIQTATARANLTATAVAQANATATFVANPYPPNSGTLALFDPLKDNSKGHRWDETTYSGGGRCQFTGGTYHAAEGTKNTFNPCFANNTTFGNFAYQAEVTILKGDCGGLVFRADSTNFKWYIFEVCQDGRYDIFLFSGNAGKYLVNQTTNASIKTGLKQTNVIAVVAKGGTIQVYVNNTSVDTVVDNSFSQGKFGVLADEYNNATEVAFANMKVWTL